MKYIVTLALMTLLGYLPTNAQGPVVARGEHNIAFVEAFAKKNTPLSSSWRENLIPYLQSKLDAAGKKIKLKTNMTDWILDKTEIVERRLKKFRNSSRVGDKVVFDKSLDADYEGMVGVFIYEELTVIIFKADCLNLLKVVDEDVPQDTPTVPVKETIRDTVYREKVIIEKEPEEKKEKEDKECCPTGFTFEQVLALLKLYMEKEQGNYMVLGQPVNNYYQIPQEYRPKWWERFFFSVGLNFNFQQRQQYIPYLEPYIPGGPVGVPGHGANGPGGVNGFPANGPVYAPGHDRYSRNANNNGFTNDNSGSFTRQVANPYSRTGF